MRLGTRYLGQLWCDLSTFIWHYSVRYLSSALMSELLVRDIQVGSIIFPKAFLCFQITYSLTSFNQIKLQYTNKWTLPSSLHPSFSSLTTCVHGHQANLSTIYSTRWNTFCILLLVSAAKGGGRLSWDTNWIIKVHTLYSGDSRCSW